MLWDYIFVGGGLSASVVSNRLHHFNSSLKILVIEAGGNANNDESVMWPNSTNLIGGEYDWKYKTVPQVALNNRNVDLPCGKALGGGTVINSGGWIRGDKYDFDLWGDLVDDHRWSYAGLLPYMKLSEDCPVDNPKEHGKDGPLPIQGIISTHREFPLRNQTLESWEAVGVQLLPNVDGNAGNPLGIGDLFENKLKGRREIASNNFPLGGVTVLTKTMVAKVLLSTPTASSQEPEATGVKLANGTEIQGKEIILSAGAIRTAQLLMLSGIGPADELKKFNIPVRVSQPDVGKNFQDHGLFASLWTLKNPSAGYAVTSPNPLWNLPQYGYGTPADFLVTTSITDKAGLAAAIEKDEGKKPDPKTHPLLKTNRTFNEHVFMYTGTPDGTTVTIMLINLLPTSKGSVTLNSSDINDVPNINPNYHSTEVDKFVAREGMRLQIDFLSSNKTALGRDIIAGELGATGFTETFTTESTDAYIDARIAAGLASTFHPMGTAAMGKVVDTNLRVKGVKKLRVVDTSVFPVTITAHLQVATYATAYQAADIIYSDNCSK
ncbi:GMC oxidoreductase [Trichoderma citrinoviride]|uniref:GMC oxidoreductase n=1 Tax=Trichoderma citrinoviride TaxID=58853 RepID=A0A2T4B098_9HYPO|nr:GMC oxidoreductase [Trichoderma citrinoviride]PTB62747.1 GMC oxidoreductase [Trichoderma citrinoviride]